MSRTASASDETANKATVARFFAALLADGQPGLLDMVAPDYQPRLPALHGLPMLAAGREALAGRLRRIGPLPHRLYRLVADGELVFAHLRYDGTTPVAGADIFRFGLDGRIAEHWNARQAIGGDTAKGIDRFAGAGDADAFASPERRERMREVTRGLLDIWRRGDAAQIGRYYDDGYIQHNPDMPGGAARIRQIFDTSIKTYREATGGDFPVACHMLGAQGDLIFVNYSVSMLGIDRREGARSTNTDIFRIDANDRMAEHWDVLQIEGEALPDDRTLF